MSISYNPAAAMIIAASAPAIIGLLQDPTVRRLAQDDEVRTAWRAAYGPLKNAVRVTVDALQRIAGTDGYSAA